jgi:hypothetical protein
VRTIIELNEFLKSLESNQAETIINNEFKFTIHYKDVIADGWNSLSNLEKKISQEGGTRENSILLMIVIQYIKVDIHVLATNLMSGLYTNAIRELQDLLVSWCLAYHIDKIHTNENVNKKIKLFQNERKMGINLFPKIFDDTSDMLDKLFEIYNRLSKKVFLSSSEIDLYTKINNDNKFIHSVIVYNESKYEEIIKDWKEVHCLILSLVES